MCTVCLVMMPAYSKLTVRELRQTCDSRGVGHEGLTKKGMIAALRDADRIDEEERDDGWDDVENNDGEVEGRGELGTDVDAGLSGGGSVTDPLLMSGTDGEIAGSEAVDVLRLRLALAREERAREREKDERARIAKERDWELEQQRAAMQAANQNTTSTRPAAKGEIHNLLPKMSEGEDTLEFFQTFERALLLNKVDRCEWPLFLPSHLTPRANKVLSNLSLEENQNYDSCKRAILAYFKLDSEAYLRNFRTARKLADENYKMYKNRLREFFFYYVQSLDIDSFESLADAMLCEQFVNTLPADVKSFVLSRQPKTADECSEFADLYYQMSRNAGGLEPGQTQGPGLGQTGKVPNDAAQRHTTRAYAANKPSNGFGQSNVPRSGGPKKTLCWGCSSPTHKYQDCPRRTRPNVAICTICSSYHPNNVPCNYRATNGVYASELLSRPNVRCQRQADSRGHYDVPIVVNGHYIHAIRDTGCFGPTLVSAKYVSENNYTGEIVSCRGAFDQTKRQVPLAIVKISAPALNCCDDLHVKVGVWQLPDDVDCLLGNSFFDNNPKFKDILCENRQSDMPKFQENIRHEQRLNSADAETDINLSPRDSGSGFDSCCSPTETRASLTGNDNPNSGLQLISDGTDSGNGQNRVIDVTETSSGQNNSLTPGGGHDGVEPDQNQDRHSTGGASDQVSETGALIAKVQTRAKTREAETPLDGEPYNEVTTDSELTDEETDTDMTADTDSDDDETHTVRQLCDIDNSDIDVESEKLPASETTATAEKFKTEQKSDPTLRAWWNRAEKGSSEFKVINGLLHHKTPPGGLATTQDYVLVIPKCYQKEVIRVAHDTVFGAHLGAKKTSQRIATQFHFPKMRQAVAKHVKCCPQCQMTAGKKVNERAPLQPIPVLESYPFDDVTMDILGPELPRTKKGNRYLLTVVCNASKWLHASPIKNCKAETIADALLEFFSYTSIPKILRCDNMPAFRSEIITELKNRLGVEIRYSVPHHYQSHGSVERANRTISDILRKFITDHPRQWDTMIPMLLFALREVPNSTTGYAPSHLVYGRKVRGLLSVMRDSWTQTDRIEEHIKMPAAKYLEQLTEQIKTALAAAGQNVRKAQQRSKERYDRHSTERFLQPGDLALILQPDQNSKMMSKWKGPFRVVRRCENNNYEIQVNNRRAMLHINSLRKYNEPEPHDALTEAVNVVLDGDFDPRVEALGGVAAHSTAQRGTEQLKFGEQLTADQRAEMQRLIRGYPDVFTDRIGCTKLVQHVITVTDEKPCYQASYRIPEALREKVEEELKNMEESGVIKYDPYNSWNSPLVVIKKRRQCTAGKQFHRAQQENGARTLYYDKI